VKKEMAVSTSSEYYAMFYFLYHLPSLKPYIFGIQPEEKIILRDHDLNPDISDTGLNPYCTHGLIELNNCQTVKDPFGNYI
jgi:hypothetical protein